MDSNLIFNFWVKVVGVDRPLLKLKGLPEGDHEGEHQAEPASNVQTATLPDETEDFEKEAEAAEQEADAAEMKAQVMERLAALVGPFKQAVATNPGQAPQLQSVFGIVKSAVGKKQFPQAMDGLDLLDQMLADESAQGGGGAEPPAPVASSPAIADAANASAPPASPPTLAPVAASPAIANTSAPPASPPPPAPVASSPGIAATANVSAPPASPPTLAPVASSPAIAATALKSNLTEAFSPVDIIPDILKEVIGGATKPQKVTGKIVNHTDQTLELDEASVSQELPHGEYNQFPTDEIEAKGSGEFLAVSKTTAGAALAGVEGEIRYLLADGQTVWTLKFNNPHFDSDNDTNGTGLSGPAAANFESVAHAGAGGEAVFTYTLKSKGGASPPPNQQPNQPPNQQPTQAVNANCVVSVTNNTQATLTLSDQKNERGDFMTNPATSLKPGASTQFVFVQTPNETEPAKLGCKGSLTWDIGSPGSGKWTCEWDNPLAEKNTATGTVEPQGSFESLEQIGQGDENVAVAFTLSGGGAGPENEVTMQSLSVSPENATIGVDEHVQFTATAQMSDGSTQDVTAEVVWNTNVLEVATIDFKGGLATGVGAGNTLVWASDPATGLGADTELTVQGGGGETQLESITIDPVNATMGVGEQIQFTATAHMIDGSTQDVTAQVVWNTNVVEVATIEFQGGLLTAVGAGNTMVWASDPATGMGSSTELTVEGGGGEVQMESITISPANGTIGVDEQIQFTATANMSDGSTQDLTAEVIWNSTDAAVATIDAQGGLGTGIDAGTTVITAGDPDTGLFDTTDLTVQGGGGEVQVQSLSIDPANATIEVGKQQQFTATANMSDGSTQDVTAAVIWNSTDSGVATITAQGGQATGAAEGTTTISAGDPATGLFATTDLTVQGGAEKPVFNPPPGEKPPTLRQGDNTADGWVEYLQQLLNSHLGAHLPTDGDFNAAVKAKVMEFQGSHDCLVDGIVGNQTWAALRQSKPEAIGTDHRKPHTFEEKGAKARWYTEHSVAVYTTSADSLQLVLVAVGEQDITGKPAHVFVTPPGGQRSGVDAKIDGAYAKTDDGEGNLHSVTVAQATKQFDGMTAANAKDCLVEAYFDQDIGGDNFSGKMLIR
jgi:hypothetical protein